MDPIILIIIGAICLFGIVAIFILMSGNPFGSADGNGNIGNIMASQRASFGDPAKPQQSVRDSEEPISKNKVRRISTEISLPKKMKYAMWTMPPAVYYLLQAVISIVVALLVSIKFHWTVVIFSLISGPLFMGWLLNQFINKRFKAFDADYAPFLLSLVSLLKTGMNTMTAIAEAAKSLEPDSLVREEIELMLERVRFGVPEDKSIGAFGETINHSEIELFVQALLLSRKVGGQISDTLERLSKQVRQRQFFRDDANGAVGMQRGSIWLILIIVFLMVGFLYTMQPHFIIDCVHDDIGWALWQGSIVAICIAILWVRRVTRIRV